MCPLCSMKTDETKWNEHLTSAKPLQSCKNVDKSIAIKFFDLIFEARPKKKENI